MSDSANNTFTIWLVRLAGRVQSLRSRVKYANIVDVERDVNTCKAQLDLLYDHALQHDINLRSFHRTLIDVEANLQYARDQIERRRAPWTEKALHVLVQAVNLVARMLNLPHLNLPGFHLPRLLGPGGLGDLLFSDRPSDGRGEGFGGDKDAQLGVEDENDGSGENDDWFDEEDDDDADDWSSDEEEGWGDADEDEDQQDDDDDFDWSSEEEERWGDADEDEDQQDDDDDYDWSSEDDDE